MHYCIGVVFAEQPDPQSLDSQLAAVLGPFKEGSKGACSFGEHYDFPTHWDYYMVGGRWSGELPGNVATVAKARRKFNRHDGDFFAVVDAETRYVSHGDPGRSAALDSFIPTAWVVVVDAHC